MIIETYTAICPVCGFNRMFMRYGSVGYYQFNACPRCGFAQDSEDNSPEFVWNIILKHSSFPDNIDEVYEWVMTFPEPKPEEVIDITFATPIIEAYKQTKLYKERRKNMSVTAEKVVFT